MKNASLTIYNRYFDKETHTDKYQRKGINLCSWNSQNTININKGYENANKVSIFIWLDDIDMSNYLEPKEFSKNILGHFTFQEGDIIVKDKISDEITSSKDLEQKYDNVFTITSVDKIELGNLTMHHFEIGGK